jgi:hypothetical protein
MQQTICYHTRAYNNNSLKLTGGTFTGTVDMETANRIANANFTVTVKPSGTPVFVDKQGREVYLYLSVEAASTEIGKEALRAWRVEREKREAEEKARHDREQADIEALMEGLSHEEIIRRLTAL